MFGQLLELPVCAGAVPDGAVPDGAVVDGVVVDGVVAVAVAPDDPLAPVAAFAIATTPPANAPVHASVASNFLLRCLMVDLLSQLSVL
jgi:hypothetical protein